MLRRTKGDAQMFVIAVLAALCLAALMIVRLSQ